MIKGIIGKPGGGKSYCALQVIVDELLSSRRKIITNVAVIIPELAQYMHDVYGDSCECSERIIILQHEDVKRFWTFRQNVLGPDGKKVAGCVFVLDELHRHYNARQWAEGDKGRACLDYITAHRHFADDIWYITQSTGFLEKQFLRVTQEFIQVRNYSKERWGWFRGQDHIKASVFLRPPDSATVLPTHGYKIFLDTKRLAKCYHTDSMDSGNIGGPADKGQKSKGLPYWSIWLIFAGVMLAIVGGMLALKKGVNAGVGKFMKVTPFQHANTTSTPITNTTVAGALASIGAPTQTVTLEAAGQAIGGGWSEMRTRVTLRSLAISGNKVDAWLSNGFRIRHTDRLLQEVGPDFIVYDGRRYDLVIGEPAPVTTNQQTGKQLHSVTRPTVYNLTQRPKFQIP